VDFLGGRLSVFGSLVGCSTISMVFGQR
jgi:hypothetical protein